MRVVFVAASLLVAAAVALPPTMLAVEKHNPKFPCFTPFACVRTFNATVPVPGAGQLLVKMDATSVNPCGVDFLEYDFGCSGANGILGMDLSGEVVAVGSNCSRLKVGDLVWADLGGVASDSGAMAEYAVVTERQTGLRPTTLSGVEAGTIPLVGLTALELWQKAWANFTGDPTSLVAVVTSGSGGTGFMALQLGKHVYNASTLITATSAANIPFVKDMGADVAIDYHVAGVFDGLADDSVDVVIDNYGAKGNADRALRTIRKGGVYILLPGGGGGQLSPTGKEGVTQINFGLTTSKDHEGLDTLKELFEQKKLRPHVQQTFDLGTADQAFALSKAGHVVGKVAVTTTSNTK